MNDSIKGNVLQIQNFSVNDGEGIRTVIFLSGCPLRCKWCANPETWSIQPKLAVYSGSCTGCGMCREACPEGLFPPAEASLAEDGCIACGSCAGVCPNNALKVLISEMSVLDVIERVKRDEVFFRESGGGVTFSGGEATLQEGFLREIVSNLHDRCIDMWIETCGFFEWEKVKDIFSKFSHVLYDIKCMDAEMHLENTGADNKRILENAKEIRKAGIPITVRIPVIPGISGTMENMEKTADFMQEHLKGADVELLPYHDLGNEKYRALGMEESLNEFEKPDKQQMEEFEQVFSRRGIAVVRYR